MSDLHDGMRELLIERGMPEDFVDGDALDWANRNLVARSIDDQAEVIFTQRLETNEAIHAMCRRYDVPDAVAEQLVSEGAPLHVALDRVLAMSEGRAYGAA